MKMTKIQKLLLFFALGVLILATGCSGDAGQRISGLDPEGTVKTFFEAAQNNRMSEAGLYVSPGSVDTGTMWKYMTGQNDLSGLKNANMLSLKKVAQQGNFAVVVATLQPEQNSFKVVVKPVGLEKINGEWYIVDPNKIVTDAKYQILVQLLAGI